MNDIAARLFTNPAWMADAPCRGQTAIFYSDQPRHAKQARAICGTCPHRVRCLEYAIDHREQCGTWGGLNITERRRIAANRKAMGWTVGRAFRPQRGEVA